jgi:hypothetical protein
VSALLAQAQMLGQNASDFASFTTAIISLVKVQKAVLDGHETV